MSQTPQRTVLHERHVSAGAKLVEFAGWDMPLHYPPGIVAEHLATRRGAGLFDVSHMGRFAVGGEQAAAFLRRVLTNDAGSLQVGRAQYTVIPDDDGGALDDAYLYRFRAEEYLLVVNAANRRRDWDHLIALLGDWPGVELSDRSKELAMLSLQGPHSEEIMSRAIEAGELPEAGRNNLGSVRLSGGDVLVGRTGYAGEPLGFELFCGERSVAIGLWDRLVELGAAPVGLGARDTLRLEAALPLYGHELGRDREGRPIPILAIPQWRLAVSLDAERGDFIGRPALERQQDARRRIEARDSRANLQALPRTIRPIAMLGAGVARGGADVYMDDRPVGYITSGTRVPYWRDGESGLRSIGLAYVDGDVPAGARVSVEIRGRRVEAVLVARHLRGDEPPFARPVLATARE